jgi:hypothetical protein
VLPGTICVREGILYADDLPARDPQGFRVLQDHVALYPANVTERRNPKLALLSRSEFVEEVIFKLGYAKNFTIAGFNLPFDLSRIAIGATKSRRHRRKDTEEWTGFYNGNSLQLFENERVRPRVVYKTIDSKRALIHFTPVDTKHSEGRGYTGNRGTFLDLRTHCFALTNKAHTLESACCDFHVPYEKRKVSHGRITPEYVEYCREDVAATSALLSKTVEEHYQHPISLQPSRALSPASIGKSYLSELGVRPVLQRQPDFDPEQLGAAMASYFGGRAECRIRKTPLPVIYVDFLSMYPTVNTLMGTWRLVTAREVVSQDVTREVRRLLADPGLGARCFEPSFWKQLVCLVEIVPDGDVVPVRARYDTPNQSWNIGVNPYRASGSTWYSLPDLVNSVLQTGRVPEVRQAIRFNGMGRQPNLHRVSLRGEVPVDPRRGDFFKDVIELRRRTEEGAPLNEFLKVLANATSYGIYAEMTREDVPDDVEVVVQRDGQGTYRTKTDAPEDPGDYCFPPIAAVITGAAKLMLGLLEREVTKSGGSYVFCDTDSMAIVADPGGSRYPCPGGGATMANGDAAVQALTTRKVRAIVKRFEALNPYDRDAVPGSILKLEKENYVGKRQTPLWCYAISAKRYVLYRRSADGISVAKEGHDFPPGLPKFSEHGLGHLLNPIDPDDESDDWIADIWQLLLHQELGLPVVEPTWLDRPALTRVTASGPTILEWFAAYNEERPYAEQIKPGNFFLIAHADPLDPSKLRPFAPYESDPTKWEGLEWRDRGSGKHIQVTTAIPDGVDRRNVIRVRTYRSVLMQYVRHPEVKSLGPDGSNVSGSTTGLLQRRPVDLLPPLHRVGKEGNKIEERMEGLTVEEEEYLNDYVDLGESIFSTLVFPILDSMNKSRLQRDHGIDRGSISRYKPKADGSAVRPRAANEALLTRVAIQQAREWLSAQGVVGLGDEVSMLRYLQLKAEEPVDAEE